MKTEYSPDGTVVRITGNYSPHPVIANSDLVQALGGPESAFHTIKQAQSMLPHPGSATHPLTLRDWRYALENAAADCSYHDRLWRWTRCEGALVRESIGYDFVFGYARREDDVDVFVDQNDQPVYRVRRPIENA